MKWRSRVLAVACMQTGCTTTDDKGKVHANPTAFTARFPEGGALSLEHLQYANRTLRLAGYAPMQGVERPAKAAKPVTKAKAKPAVKAKAKPVAVKTVAKAPARKATKASPQRVAA